MLVLEPTYAGPVVAPLPKLRFTPDPQQQAVIDFDGGALCIDAGAGSGKSSTLVARIRRLILAGTEPASIVAFTFTRKGADAIIDKLVQICGDLGRKVVAGTFHRIAAQEMISLSKGDRRWHVIDENDTREMWKSACTEVAAELLPAAFHLEMFTGRAHPNKETEKRIRALFEGLREIRSFQVNMNRGAEAFGPIAHKRLVERSGSYRTLLQTPNCPSFLPFFEECLRRYEGAKRLNAAKDYDDLLVDWLEVLRSNDAYRMEIRDRWRHVIVDEYQDTNHLQEEVIKYLNVDRLTVVGDLGQCMYSWRCAVPDLMASFGERYPATFLSLDFNYRSRTEIIEVANGVLDIHFRSLRRSRARLGKPAPRRIELQSTRGAGGRVSFFSGRSNFDELQRIAVEIERLIDQGEEPKNIAVLCRAAYYAEPLEARLRALRFKGEMIKVQVWGGRSVLASAAARDLMGMLHAIIRPGDPWPYERLAKRHPGIGEVGAREGFFSRMFCLPPPLPLQGLTGLLGELNTILQRRDRSSTDRMMAMVKLGTDYLERLYASLKMDDVERRSLNGDLTSLKAGIMGAIEDMARRAAETNQPFALADIINTFSLDPNKDPHDPEALTISTVHSAKGLEWKHVFVIGVNDGLLPLIRKKDEEGVPTAEDIGQTQADMEEECRILYVAVTRAIDNLSISFAADRGASRFLMAIPALAQRCNEAAAPFADAAPPWRRPG